MFSLETARLIIRPWTNGERGVFAAITSSPEVTQFVHHGTPYSEQEIDDFLSRQARHLAEYDVCMGVVIEKASSRAIGISGVQPLGTTGDLEIGWIFDREAWGHGYATEAGAAAMKHVLETLQRPRVMAIIDPGNAPSQRVAARLGMELVRRVSGHELGHRIPEIIVDLFQRPR